MKPTANLRILEQHSLIPPSVIMEELPLTDEASEVVVRTRSEISDIIHGKDEKRMLVVVGPCSVHDIGAVMEYAEKLKPKIKEFQKELLIVMRVYFEKPRTTVGWKGLINDPDLEGRILQTTVQSSQEIPNITDGNRNLFSTLKNSPTREDFDRLTRELLGITPAQVNKITEDTQAINAIELVE